MSQIAKPKKDTGPETHMSKAEVRALWPDADEQIFNSAYKIFDWTAHSEDEKADEHEIEVHHDKADAVRLADDNFEV